MEREALQRIRPAAVLTISRDRMARRGELSPDLGPPSRHQA